MGRKRLIWLSLALLFGCMPVIARQYQSSQQDLDQQNSNLPQNQGVQNPNLPQNQGQDVTPSQPSTTTLDKTVRSGGPYAIGYEEGYKRGFDHGKSDFASGAKYDYDDFRDYKHTKTAWDSSMGSRKKFRKNYHRGFRIGYEDGYSGKPSQFSAIAVPVPVPQAQAPIPPETSQSTESESESSGMLNQNPPSSTQGTINEAPPSTVPSTSASVGNENENVGMGMGTEARLHGRRLPRTASSLPLFGLIGMVAVPLALALRFVSSRMA